MASAQNHESFVPLRRAASRLGVPIAWLKAEAEAGRVAHLKVGRRLLFNLAAVECDLIHRSMSDAQTETSAEVTV